MASTTTIPPAWVHRLADAELLGDLEPQLRAELLAIAGRRAATRRSTLFRAGEPAEHLFVVVDGRVKLVRGNAAGEEVILRYVGPGELLGAVALLPAATYPASAEAADDVELAFWSRSALATLTARHPALATLTLAVVSGRMQQLQGQLHELATERVAQRLARAVLRLARQAGRKTDEGILIDMPISRQDLAALTGTTLFTVSRLLSSWEEAGLVAAGRERLVIRQAHGLVRIAEDLPAG